MKDKTYDAFGASDIPPETADQLAIERLRQRVAVLEEALQNILAVEPIERLNGTTSWILTCTEMRVIAVEALATTEGE